jgi:hypothetical protein
MYFYVRYQHHKRQLYGVLLSGEVNYMSASKRQALQITGSESNNEHTV